MKIDRNDFIKILKLLSHDADLIEGEWGEAEDEWYLIEEMKTKYNISESEIDG